MSSSGVVPPSSGGGGGGGATTGVTTNTTTTTTMTTTTVSSGAAAGTNMSAEQLQARYIGTGHADLSKYEWLTHQHRDTYASHVGHYDQMSYYAVAMNESIGRTRLQFLENMILPCGPPPPTKDVNKLLEKNVEQQ